MSADVRWSPLADTYLPADLRDRSLAEAARSTWYPIEGRHPMSPGWAVKLVLPLLAEIGLPRITEIAYDRSWSVREDTTGPPSPGSCGSATSGGTAERPLNVFGWG